MTLIVNDRVQEVSTSTGSGPFVLGGGVTGYQTFSVGIGNTNSTYYTITNGTNWMDILGTYTSAANSITVDKILTSSAGGTTAVSFAAGTKNIFCTYPAATAVLAAPAAYPTIQPTLNLDFANTKLLDPRITFVRNSTAAYYDGQTTAMAEQNLLLQSQTFATTWVTSNTTLGSVTTAPDGTTTAYPLTASAINGTLLQTFTATATAYTFSIYIQRVTGTGNIDITVDGTTYATQTTSGTWTRFTITTTPAAGSKTAGIRLAVSGDVVNIWGAQLEQRSAVTAYTPTTTAAITNYIPVLMTAPAGVARFDCDPITRNSLGLLIEESRTNLLTYSSDFTAWSGGVFGGLVITPAQNIAPDGNLTASLFSSSASSTAGTLVRKVTTTAINTAYTASCYFKQGSARYGLIRLIFVNTGGDCYFDLQSGVVSSQSAGITSATITPVGNGWYKCVATGTTQATITNNLLDVGLSTSSGAFTAVSGSSVFTWGAQLEAGAFATSYIPTVASTVTRAADSASMTGTNFSSWYNQAQGTYYLEAEVARINANSIYWLYGGVTNIRYIMTGGNSLTIGMYDGISNPFSTIDLNAGATNKLISAYTNTTNSITANGKAPYSASFLTASQATQIIITGNGSALNGHIRKLSYYPITLSSSNLVALTS